MRVLHIQATYRSFAAILDDGSVATWGRLSDIGDCSVGREVQEKLVRVQQIQATCGAFAAVRDDGSVVTWGEHWCGGDSRQVQKQLVQVKQTQQPRRPSLQSWTTALW